MKELTEMQDKLNAAKPEVLGAILSRAAYMKKSKDEAERNVGVSLYQQVLLAFTWQAEQARLNGEDFSYPAENYKKCSDFTCDCESHL